jgi:ATP-dependent Clp protease adaptor protein ClpS
MKKENNLVGKPLDKEVVESSRGVSSFLILHNDDVNSFDYVIDSLMEVCSHDETQAEQCAYIAHYKGLCDIKKGTQDVLAPMQSELNRRGIIVTID